MDNPTRFGGLAAPVGLGRSKVHFDSFNFNLQGDVVLCQVVLLGKMALLVKVALFQTWHCARRSVPPQGEVALFQKWRSAGISDTLSICWEKCYSAGRVLLCWESITLLGECYSAGRSVSLLGEVLLCWEKCYYAGRSVTLLGEC
jgi:hypothetical protein